MNFLIELRHILTGLARTCFDRQEVADFLAARNKDEWTGWESLGVLPEPTAVTTAEAPMVDAAAEPIAGEPVVHEISVASAPDGVFVEGAGLVMDEQLHEAGFERAGPNHTLMDIVRSGIVTQEGDTITFNRTAISQTVVPVEIAVGDSGKGDSYLPIEQPPHTESGELLA